MTKVIANTKFTTIKLNDAQRALMSPALQREDRFLAPIAILKGAIRRKAFDKLMEAGPVREVRAKPEMRVWRRDDETGPDYALKLTVAGARAIAVHEDDGTDEHLKDPEGSAPMAKSGGTASSGAASILSDDVTLPRSETLSDDGRSSRTPNNVTIGLAEPIGPSVDQITAPRADTKIAAVLELLARNEGASIDELIVSIGWLAHITRAALTGLRQRGYAIERSQENDVTRYRVTNGAAFRRCAQPSQTQTIL